MKLLKSDYTSEHPKSFKFRWNTLVANMNQNYQIKYFLPSYVVNETLIDKSLRLYRFKTHLIMIK